MLRLSHAPDPVRLAARRSRHAWTIAVLLLLLGAGPATAQDGDACDCSCDRYARMLAATDEARAAAEAGRNDAIPTEVDEMSRCASQCAMRWMRCDTRGDGRGGDSARDAASGESGPATTDAYLEMMRGAQDRRARDEAQPEPALPKDRLTPSYLEGRWCSVYGGQETTEWSFDAEGDHRVGVPAGSGYAMQPDVRDLEHFRGRFERLIRHEPDTFTTVHRHGRENVFTRGPCD